MLAFVVSLIATAVFVITTAASADPIFPPLVSGEYRFGCRTAVVPLDAEGVPMVQPTASVGIRVDGAPAAELAHCEDAGPDGDVTPVLVTLTPAGDRAAMRCVAFAAPACTGPESEASDDAAFVFFVPPGIPSIELSP